ncbi:MULTISPECIES: TonB family protein [Acidobacteriaceae]|uniref:M56 family metallopeptidase n=1 Tax=Acidobacteriaceae TaxID=204434 RepID=UPI00131D59DE|nr:MULTISPECIES: M56 family metallopeptidase [Acidobacteriaceae]MDW5264176.1 M56 family metallopeptidase [Edaphobacter sp.]
MNSFSGFMVSYFINSIWEVALIAAAGWLVSRLLKKAGPQAEHLVWVSTLGLAILAPAFPFFRWLLAFVHLPHVAGGHTSIAFVAAQGAALNQRGIYILPAVLVGALLSLYFGALIYFAMRLAWSLRSTARLLRLARPLLLTEEQEEIWLDCKRAFGLDQARILCSSRIAGPVTLGLREPMLLVPDAFVADCAPQDLLAALAHECAHMKRRDFQKNLFYEVASLLLAFHPVIWVLKIHIAQTREMICDGMATDKLIDSRKYTDSLLRLATMVAVGSRAYPSHAIGIFDANILEKRIMMMNLKKPRVSSALKYGLVIPATVFLLSVAVGGAAMAVVIEPQASTQVAEQSQPYGQVYHLGKDVIAPVLVWSVEPEYPEAEKKSKDKFGGTCLIELVVDSSGMVHDVHVKRSLRPDFDANAVKTVEQYRFKPATRAGEPVAVALNIEVNFQKF